MKIKYVTIARTSIDERISVIFKQLGAKTVKRYGEDVLCLFTDPEVMVTKMEIAYEQLKRLGYETNGQNLKHFWYFHDLQEKLPEISVEAQDPDAGANTRINYFIYW